MSGAHDSKGRDQGASSRWTQVDASGKVEPYTWKAIANIAALSLAAIATELQGIRRAMESTPRAHGPITASYDELRSQRSRPFPKDPSPSSPEALKGEQG